jgi:hypothetical protein
MIGKPLGCPISAWRLQAAGSSTAADKSIAVSPTQLKSQPACPIGRPPPLLARPARPSYFRMINDQGG